MGVSHAAPTWRFPETRDIFRVPTGRIGGPAVYGDACLRKFKMQKYASFAMQDQLAGRSLQGSDWPLWNSSGSESFRAAGTFGDRVVSSCFSGYLLLSRTRPKIDQEVSVTNRKLSRITPVTAAEHEMISNLEKILPEFGMASYVGYQRSATSSYLRIQARFQMFRVGHDVQYSTIVF